MKPNARESRGWGGSSVSSDGDRPRSSLAQLEFGVSEGQVAVFRATLNVAEQDPPPQGRLHFFAIGAMLGNLVFLVIILLSGVATIVDRACHQA